MQQQRINLTLVGGFVVLAAATLVVTLALLAGRTGATDDYHLELANVSGLDAGSPVRFEGYRIGQVESITPVQEDGTTRFRVDITVREGWQIPRDSLARSTASGLLEPQNIAIEAGKDNDALQPGSRINAGAPTGIMQTAADIAGRVDELAEGELLPLLRNVNRQVTAIGSLFDDDIRSLVRDADDVMADSRPILRSVARSADNIERLTTRLDEDLGPEEMAALRATITDIRATADGLRQLGEQLGSAADTGSEDLTATLEEVRLTAEALSRHADSISHNLDVTVRNMQEFSRHLRSNPGALLRGAERIEDPMLPRSGSEPGE